MIIHLFYFSGAGVQLKTSDGRSALHVAASSGHLESAELLLRHGAQMNVKDQLGDTPLHKAAKGLFSRLTLETSDVYFLNAIELLRLPDY